ncbi:hypothetical protein Lfu02_79670 [Longispora fulva]|nr:hypothetical protein Lfu02_79670 [Longispora fulva]
MLNGLQAYVDPLDWSPQPSIVVAEVQQAGGLSQRVPSSPADQGRLRGRPTTLGDYPPLGADAVPLLAEVRPLARTPSSRDLVVAALSVGEENVGVVADLYLLAHDEISGGPLASAQAVAVGLAAGLVAELMSVGLVLLTERRLDLTRPAANLADGLLAKVASDLEQVRGGDLARWLRFWADDAVTGVRARLVDAGRLREKQRRRFGWSRSPTFVPTSWQYAAGRAVLLRSALTDPPAAPPSMRLLAGLVHAVSLTDWLTRDQRSLRRAVPDMVAGLPPPLRHLLAVTAATVASAATTP